MEQTKVTNFLTQKRELLFGSQSFDQDIIEKMIIFPDDQFAILEHLPLRKPTTAKLIAVFPGIIGIDCFYLGNIQRGIIKYFTFGGLGILWLKDIKNAEERCRAHNRKTLLEVLNDPSVGIKMIERNSNAKKAFEIARQVAPEVIKGAKDIHDTTYV